MGRGRGRKRSAGAERGPQCPLAPAFTCSDQDVRVSQQGEDRGAFGALRGGKEEGYLGRELPGRPPPPSAQPSRVSHLPTHLGADLRGLQYAELQSWGENAGVSSLLETAPLQSAFPSGFSFSPTPFIGRAPGDAVTVFGVMVQAGRGRDGSQPRSHRREQQSSLKQPVFAAFCQPLQQSNTQMLAVRLPAACWGATTRA